MEASSTDEDKEEVVVLKEFSVRVPRLTTAKVPCLFIGKRARVISLSYCGLGNPNSYTCDLSMFQHCPSLEQELKEVEMQLDVSCSRNKICHVASLYHVHVYMHNSVQQSALVCSD